MLCDKFKTVCQELQVHLWNSLFSQMLLVARLPSGNILQVILD
jgi:hypothetical protein